jgi:hypothetical protein
MGFYKVMFLPVCWSWLCMIVRTLLFLVNTQFPLKKIYIPYYFPKSTRVNFDYVYANSYIRLDLEYQINLVRFSMKYSLRFII